MPEIKAMFTGISDLSIKSKVVVVDKENGDKEVATQINFDIDGDPQQMQHILRAMASGARVDVVFTSPQLEMKIT
jgi:hypothetical protein